MTYNATLVTSCLISTIVFCQDITIQYKKANGVTVTAIPIKKDTKQIVLENAPNLRNFTIVAQNIPIGVKLNFADKNDKVIPPGDYTAADISKNYTAPADLNDKALIIYLIDGNGIKTQFARVALLDQLPNSQLDIASPLSTWMTNVKKVCEPCDTEGRALIYDFSKNTFPKNDFKHWPKKWARVNASYKFIVKNINPFRDSVMIGSEFANYNTDIPDLFTKAFFSSVAAVGSDPQEAEILSDVIALADQIDVIMNNLKQAKECDEICSFIQKTKESTEKHFHDNYQFDASKNDLVSFIADRLQGINDTYKDNVANALLKYKTFINVRNYFTYYIPRVQNVDAYIFNLTIIPKKDAQLPAIVDHQPITIPTLSGWKFDFSTGLFLTGLRDQNFNLIPDSSVIRNSNGGDSIVFNRSNQIVQQTDERGVDFGVAALMHIYPRISPSFNISATIGAGLSIGPNPSIRYLGGGSLLFGRNGRLALTYGCAAGFVEQLADPYQNDQFISLNDKSKITKKVFKTGSFVSLSFSIPIFKSKVIDGVKSADGGGDASDVKK